MEMTTNQCVVDEDVDVVKKKCKDGVGSGTQCPASTRREKQMKKEDEMVNRLSQKSEIMSNKTKKQQRNQPDEDNDEEHTCIARSTCRIPVILLICREPIDE